MRSKTRFWEIKILLFATIISLGIFLSHASASFPALIVRGTDTLGVYGSDDVIIPIYLSNWEDTVASFVITLTTSHPDVVDFQIGAFDTSGTLTSGWQYIETSGDSNTIRIEATANLPSPPYQPGIGYPTLDVAPLIKVLADINQRPDTITTTQAEVIIKDDIDDLIFLDENGDTLALIYGDTTYDTTWFNCTEWNIESPEDSSCINWVIADGPPADSLAVDTSLIPSLDTSQIHVYNGTLFLEPCQSPGDLNHDGAINIFDITYFISYLYLNGPSPFPPMDADTNCDCEVNVLDITCMIFSLYQFGWFCEPCTCEEWEINCGK